MRLRLLEMFYDTHEVQLRGRSLRSGPIARTKHRRVLFFDAAVAMAACQICDGLQAVFVCRASTRHWTVLAASRANVSATGLR
jgi:hypothetical protein